MKIERITFAALVVAVGLSLVPAFAFAGDGDPPAPPKDHNVEISAPLL